ncbi:MAG: hypothetical protein J6W82_04075 [Bacteroidales bacterium]|nr:hypothetical protein [Bacteroidales bacterium]
MKKLFLAATAAIILASCTYESTIVSNRTPANLAALNIELINNSVSAATITLSDLDMQCKDTILTAAFDTLITAEAYYNRFGAAATEMDVQLVADSTWTFASTGTGAVAFSGIIKMTGRNDEKYPVFDASYTGAYDEGNGFTADFSSAKLTLTIKTSQEYVEGYGIASRLMLHCYGDAQMKTYRNSQNLDSVTTTFNGDKVSY